MPSGKDWKILNGFRGEAKKEYLAVVDNLRKIIRKNFEKYEVDGRLSMQNMNKFNRLNKMLDEMLGQVNTLITDRNSGIKKSLGQSFKAAFKRQARRVEKDAKQILGLSVPSSAPVVANDGLTAATLADNAAKTRSELRRTILRNLNSSAAAKGDEVLFGATLREFLGATDDMMSKDYTRFVRVIDSEGTRVNANGQKSVWDATQNPDNYRKRIKIFSADTGSEFIKLKGKKNVVKLYGGREVDLGDLYVKVWVHDGPKVARPGHLAADGDYADENGMFSVNGYSVSAPGEFGDPAEDVNCLCSISIERRQAQKA